MRQREGEIEQDSGLAHAGLAHDACHSITGEPEGDYPARRLKPVVNIRTTQQMVSEPPPCFVALLDRLDGRSFGLSDCLNVEPLQDHRAGHLATAHLAVLVCV